MQDHNSSNSILNLLTQKKTVIGAIHFSPSPGFEGSDSMAEALERAQQDLTAFISGGVDAVIFENNYDLPHTTLVGHATTAYMTALISRLQFKKHIPFGVSVLWNDYQSALAVAKATGGSFIRIPAFVDSVITSYGTVRSVAKKAIEYRTHIGAQQVAICSDVHVKHAEMLYKKKTLTQSLQQAQKMGADALIITGKWTGDAPDMKELQLAQRVSDLPIIIGSGASSKNIQQLFLHADGAIVSTALKSGRSLTKKEHVNLSDIDQRIDEQKVRDFIACLGKS